jgi:hypothetical protein
MDSNVFLMCPFVLGESSFINWTASRLSVFSSRSLLRCISSCL